MRRDQKERGRGERRAGGLRASSRQGGAVMGRGRRLGREER